MPQAFLSAYIKLTIRLDLTDVRDDGNDPLRPVIARACEWMEQARASGGCVLVHCRVGVSRSASIVVSTHAMAHELPANQQMAYLMKYRGLGLIDAYLMTRARRLNGEFNCLNMSS